MYEPAPTDTTVTAASTTASVFGRDGLPRLALALIAASAHAGEVDRHKRQCRCHAASSGLLGAVLADF